MSGLPVDSVFAGYRIERVLGMGGMGTVYLARNPDLPRSEALKVLSADLSHDPGFRARFVREADVAAALDHPNVVSVHQRGEYAGQLWIAMQYVPGTDADAALKAATITPTRALRIVTEVGKALDYAHQRGVVHRDVKPANFLLAPVSGDDERVLLADFGIARALGDAALTSTGAVMATLAYAAPEVLSGMPFDGRADLYSLGCSLFKLLTGKSPYHQADGAAAVMAAHLTQPPPRITDLAPWLPPALDTVMATAMAKDPAHRYPTARELTDAAARALYTGQTRAHPANATSWQAGTRVDSRPDAMHSQLPLTQTMIRGAGAAPRRPSWHGALVSLSLTVLSLAMFFLQSALGGNWYLIRREPSLWSGLLIVGLDALFVVGVCLLARSPGRRIAATLMAVIAVAIDLVNSFGVPFLSGWLAPGSYSLLLSLSISTAVAAFFAVVAWAVARRSHLLWVFGLAPAYTAVVVAIIASIDLWFIAVRPLRIDGSLYWLTNWITTVGPIVLGSLACWAFDALGTALSRRGRRGARTEFARTPAHNHGGDPQVASRWPGTTIASPQFALGDAMSWAWEKYLASAAGSMVTALLQVVAAVFAIGGFGLLYAAGMDRGPSVGLSMAVFALIAAVAMAACQAIYVSGGIATVRRDHASMHDFFGNPRLPAVFGAAMLTGAIVAIGNVVLVLPGLIALLLLQYAVFFAADTGMGALNSVAASARLASANLGTSLLIVVAVAMLNGLGSLACGVGLVVTIPLSVLLQARVYDILTHQSTG